MTTENTLPSPPPSNPFPHRVASGWPERPPVFAPLETPEELLVPLASYVPGKAAQAIRGRLRQGERLLDHPAESSHLPIAPADAVADAELTVSLLDGRQVPAARLTIKPIESPESQQLEATPIANANELSEIPPRDLGLWIDRMRDHGIWADRWTSPDLLGQLNISLRRPIDTILCNVLDVDPTVPLNAALAANHPVELLAGLSLLSGITSATRTWIITDSAAPPEWFSPLRVPQASTPAGLRLVPLANDYPQADPSLLLYALLDRRLRPGRLPAELGALVIDSAAAIAVGRLALTHQPMLRVPIAVRDHARRESHFRTVPIGTPLTYILHRLGIAAVSRLVVRGGDVLRDIHLSAESVIAGTELLIHASPLEPPINPDPCIRCGWCFESCPTYVQPANCLEAAQREDADMALRFGIEGCIDCGICSYVCPSHLPILTGIRQMRMKLAE